MAVIIIEDGKSRVFLDEKVEQVIDLTILPQCERMASVILTLDEARQLVKDLRRMIKARTHG